jgi:hypothetical protein
VGRVEVCRSCSGCAGGGVGARGTGSGGIEARSGWEAVRAIEGFEVAEVALRRTDAAEMLAEQFGDDEALPRVS